MKIIITILLLFALSQAKAQDREANLSGQLQFAGIDTAKCVFEVSSLRYEYAKKVIKQGYIIRIKMIYTGDKMPCATSDSDCDYSPIYKTIKYLDSKKKQIDEVRGWHIWHCELIESE